MSSIYITGDIHADPSRLNIENFPDQKNMIDGQDNNYVIICGDFGLVWEQLYENKRERWWLNWLENKNFTTLFVDGNHENFDRLYSSEYPIEEWCGGKIQKIRHHVIHLLRGECYNILGKKIFTFGGAASHDIRDGILDPVKDEELIKEWSKCYYKLFRINHVSWWEQELASDIEMQHGREVLANNKNCVDFIVTHCAPQDVCYMLPLAGYQSDKMTLYFNEIASLTQFQRWYCGHYHCDERIMGKFDIMYEKIHRIV
jgi:hypothetical protein